LSLSNVVEHFTRFTDDIFSTLISVIFIAEAVKNLSGNFTNPAVTGMQSFITLFVALTTFFTGRILSGLRRSPFLIRKVREVVSAFAPTIGVLSGIGAAAIATKKYDISLPMLTVPSLLSTTCGRPWLVDIFAVSNKVKVLCFFPAVMATVLLFMDQNITVRLIMSKENKLKKGSGLHLDMFVVSIVTAITSLLGMPWMVAATVRSLAHMRSLKQYKITDGITLGSNGSSLDVSSQATVEVTGVQEQRLTGLMIHSLIGYAIIYMRPLLQRIPNAVLTGLFLYLGVSSITATDLFDRFKLFFTDKRDVPIGYAWSSGVSLQRTKLFTSIQVLLIAAMWWVKETKLGVFFPVLIGVLAPVRIALEKCNIFTKIELDLLDVEIA
jgi:HCO3- transporter family